MSASNSASYRAQRRSRNSSGDVNMFMASQHTTAWSMQSAVAPRGNGSVVETYFVRHVQQLRRAYLSAARLPCERSFPPLSPSPSEATRAAPPFLFMPGRRRATIQTAWRGVLSASQRSRVRRCPAVALGNNEVHRQLPAPSFGVYVRRAVKCARRELWRNSVPSLCCDGKASGADGFYFCEREVGG